MHAAIYVRGYFGRAKKENYGDTFAIGSTVINIGHLLGQPTQATSSIAPKDQFDLEALTLVW